MPQKVRFGIQIPAVPEWLELVQEAERVGFDHVWFSADFRYMESFSALGYALPQTSRVQIGAMANSVFLRHPVLLASGTSILEYHSPGRVALGLSSAGYETSVGLGIPDEDSVQACREAIEIIQKLWQGNPVDYSGTHWQLNGVQLPILDQPKTPIFLATRGRKFQLGGELADGVATHGKTPAYLHRMNQELSKGAVTTGRQLSDLEREIFVPVVLTSAHKVEQIKESVKTLMGFYVGGEYSLGWLNTLNLSLDEVQPLRQEIQKHGFNSDLEGYIDADLRDRLIDAFCIVGTIDDCLNEIAQLHQHDANLVVSVLHPMVYSDLQMIRKFIQQFGADIIQQFPIR